MGGVRIIGDVHGKRWQYRELVTNSPHQCSIQIGDLDFEYSWLAALDPERHKVLAGNHDNYLTLVPGDNTFIMQTAHFLGDFGIYKVPNYREVFFVRGGRSIDEEYRTLGIDYFREEELNLERSYQAFEAYKKAEPRVVISHECPTNIIPLVSPNGRWKGKPIIPSSTANLLQHMLDAWKPLLWIFGHHHVHLNTMVGRTNFICLPELGFIDLEEIER
jgi:hypothetical protein